MIKLTTIAVVGLSSTLLTVPAQAESVEKLEEKQTELQEQRDALKADLTEAESKIADVLADLEKLNEEIEKVNKALKENQKQLDKTQADIKDTEAEVKALESEIAELEAAIEKRHDILKERAVAYQKSGGDISYLEVIFGSQNFSDFISRVSAVNKITESDSALIEKQEADKSAVEEKQNKVIEKLDELKEMEVELEGIITLVEDQKAANEDKKAELKDKEEDLLALKEELQMEDSNLASLEDDVQASIEAAREAERQEAQEAVATTNSAESSEEGEESGQSDSRPAASGNLSTAINAGFAHLGTPYVWGGKTPSGFDCSGFVSWAFAQAGISIPSSTSALAGVGTKVSPSNMQPGDIVFFNTYKTNGHVGIYLGGGKFIGAQSSTGLAVADMSSGYWADKFSGHVRSVN